MNDDRKRENAMNTGLAFGTGGANHSDEWRNEQAGKQVSNQSIDFYLLPDSSMSSDCLFFYHV